MAVSTEDLEAQQAELEPEAAGEQAEETSADALEDQSTQLATQESATERQLADLQRQLSRMESRFDRGGTDAASIRQLRTEIGQIAQRLDDVKDMRELIDGLLESNVPPEKLALLKVKQAETRATRAESRARAAEEQASQPVSLKPAAEAGQSQAEATAIQEATATLVKRMTRFGYDANDQATFTRLAALVPNLGNLDVNQRLNALTDALHDMAEADDRTTAQAGRRQTARAAVRTDRSAAGGTTSATQYTSYEDLCAAHMAGTIETADVARIKAAKGW